MWMAPSLSGSCLEGWMDLKGRFLCRPSAVANAAAMRVGQRARAPSKADAAVDRRRAAAVGKMEASASVRRRYAPASASPSSSRFVLWFF